MEKKTKKQVDPLKSLNLSNKIDELKQIESIFPQNQMNDLILDKLKEIKQLQDNIELNELDYKAKCKKIYSFCKISLPIVILRIFINRRC